MNKYQTVGARFFASIIDSILLIPISFVIRKISIQSDLSTLSVFWGEILVQFLSLLYFVLMHNFYGQTLGKMLLKVKVYDISEQPISFLQSVLRSLPTLLALVFTVNFNNPQITNGTASSVDIWVARNLTYWLATLFFLFSLANSITLLIDKKHRALHDYIAGTVVIKN